MAVSDDSRALIFMAYYSGLLFPVHNPEEHRPDSLTTSGAAPLAPAHETPLAEAGEIEDQ